MTKLLRLTAATVAIVASASAVRAQEPPPAPRPDRPYRGLFGGGIGKSDELLSLGVTFATGYDQTTITVAGGNAGLPGDLLQPGWYQQAGVALRYAVSRKKVSFGSSLAVLGRYQGNVDSKVVSAYSAGVGVDYTPRESTQLRVSQAASLQPYAVLFELPTAFDPQLGQVQATTPDFATDRRRYRVFTTTLSLRQRLTRRLEANGGYEYRLTQFPTSFVDFGRNSFSGGLRYQLTKNLGLHGGYIQDEVGFSLSTGHRSFRRRVLDAGIDFNRPISLSRRTTLTFGTGTAAVVDGERTRYHLTGSARLQYEIQRSWTAAVGYDRTAAYEDTFLQPVFSDAVVAGVNGLISRRVTFRSGVTAARGEIGVQRQDQGFSNLTTATTLGFALGRRIEVGIEHFYYRHGFDPAVVLPAGVPPELDRHTARVFMTFWEPLFHRRGVMNAPR